MPVPQFPTFAPLTLEHRSFVISATDNFSPYSDYNFTSLYAWNTDGNTEISQYRGNLVIKMDDYVDPEKTMLTCLPTTAVDETLHTVLEYAQTIGIEGLHFMPKEVVDQIEDPDQFHIVSDRDQHDYMLSFDHHVDMIGQHFKKRRNMKKKFLSVVSSEDIQIDIFVPTDVHKETVVSHFDAWVRAKQRNTEDIQAERHALIRFFECIPYGSYYLFLLYIDSTLEIFSLVETVSDTCVVNHFTKSIASYPGISEYFLQQQALFFQQKGYQHFNIEQDLGIIGLRKNKELHRPARMLEKFIIHY